jgi:hypothetical protein
MQHVEYQKEAGFASIVLVIHQLQKFTKMKKSVATPIVAMMLALASLAQESNTSNSYGTPAAAGAKRSKIKTDAQLKAERFFYVINESAENINWYQGPDGFQAYYLDNGKHGITYFDKKGDFLHTILSYSETLLSSDIRKRVKSLFYLDYSITNVAEIRKDKKSANNIYLVLLTNGKEWVRARVDTDEIAVIERFPAL